ncbi:hypothetical protein HDZ31DRAFT_64883 [Schizophyllum fasciatum]
MRHHPSPDADHILHHPSPDADHILHPPGRPPARCALARYFASRRAKGKAGHEVAGRAGHEVAGRAGHEVAGSAATSAASSPRVRPYELAHHSRQSSVGVDDLLAPAGSAFVRAPPSAPAQSSHPTSHHTHAQPAHSTSAHPSHHTPAHPSSHHTPAHPSHPAPAHPAPDPTATVLAAQRILALATESLDMMRGVTGVVRDSLDRADAWVGRLGMEGAGVGVGEGVGVGAGEGVGVGVGGQGVGVGAGEGVGVGDGAGGRMDEDERMGRESFLRGRESAVRGEAAHERELSAGELWRSQSAYEPWRAQPAHEPWPSANELGLGISRSSSTASLRGLLDATFPQGLEGDGREGYARGADREGYVRGLDTQEYARGADRDGAPYREAEGYARGHSRQGSGAGGREHGAMELDE